MTLLVNTRHLVNFYKVFFLQKKIRKNSLPAGKNISGSLSEGGGGGGGGLKSEPLVHFFVLYFFWNTSLSKGYISELVSRNTFFGGQCWSSSQSVKLYYWMCHDLQCDVVIKSAMRCNDLSSSIFNQLYFIKIWLFWDMEKSHILDNHLGWFDFKPPNSRTINTSYKHFSVQMKSI